MGSLRFRLYIFQNRAYLIMIKPFFSSPFSTLFRVVLYLLYHQLTLQFDLLTYFRTGSNILGHSNLQVGGTALSSVNLYAWICCKSSVKSGWKFWQYIVEKVELDIKQLTQVELLEDSAYRYTLDLNFNPLDMQ